MFILPSPHSATTDDRQPGIKSTFFRYNTPPPTNHDDTPFETHVKEIVKNKTVSVHNWRSQLISTSFLESISKRYKMFGSRPNVRVPCMWANNSFMTANAIVKQANRQTFTGNHNFYVFTQLNANVILGRDFQMRTNMIDSKRSVIYFLSSPKDIFSFKLP